MIFKVISDKEKEEKEIISTYMSNIRVKSFYAIRKKNINI